MQREAGCKPCSKCRSSAPADPDCRTPRRLRCTSPAADARARAIAAPVPLLTAVAASPSALLVSLMPELPCLLSFSFEKKDCSKIKFQRLNFFGNHFAMTESSNNTTAPGVRSPFHRQIIARIVHNFTPRTIIIAIALCLLYKVFPKLMWLWRRLKSRTFFHLLASTGN
jgi:hypothetical protein